VLRGEYKLEIPEINRAFLESVDGEAFREVLDNFNRNRDDIVTIIYLAE